MAWVTKRRASDGALHYQGRYRDPFGAKRTVGTFPSHRQALKAANRAEGTVLDGTWLDPNAGTVTFQQYAEEVWLPSRHLEISTRTGYRSYLRIHFVQEADDGAGAVVDGRRRAREAQGSTMWGSS